MSKRLYVAYGSNLNIQQMTNRCPGARKAVLHGTHIGKGSARIADGELLAGRSLEEAVRDRRDRELRTAIQRAVSRCIRYDRPKGRRIGAGCCVGDLQAE